MSLTEKTFDGLYSGRWEVGFEPYDGADFSRLCCLFSGQGSAVPGMFLSAYRERETVRQRFDEADALSRAAGLPPPSLYITEAKAIHADALVVTRNLATFTVQVALFDHLSNRLAPPKLLTGSSQGEYTALVCSGAVDFATLFEVIIARHRICGPANKLGFLLAIAAAPAEIASALGREQLHVSIVNSPVRTVVAVAPEQIDEVQDRLKRKGIGAKQLDVPHPYHSPLMREAAERFRLWLEERRLGFRPPCLPVLSSVTREVVTEGLSASDAAALLSRQLTEPVDFPKQIEIAYARRCYAFLEVGPGATLGTFVRRILGPREHKTIDLDAWLPPAPPPRRPNPRLDAVQSRVFGALRKAVAKLTGYEIESISFEDRFQEDLAIDSLKKVEVLVEVMGEIDPERKELGRLAGVQRLADVVEAFTQLQDEAQDEKNAPAPPKPARFERCTVLWEEAPLAAPIPAAPMTELRLAPLKALLDGNFRLDDLAGGSGLVLIAGAEDFAAGDGAGQKDLDRLLVLFNIFQPLRDWLQDRDLDLALVTAGDSHPYALGLAAFFKALMQEVPGLGFKHLDFDTLPAEAELVARVHAERADRTNIGIRYESGRRKVAVLSALPEPSLHPTVLSDAVIVAFGGAKGITNALLESLTVNARPYLYLAGRSSEQDVAEALATLSQLSATLHYTSLDARDGKAVAQLFELVCETRGRIDLVINAVGVEESCLLANKSPEAMRAELAIKVLATRHILCAAKAVSARLVVSFGSLAGRWGNAGQTVYSCAGEIVTRLTAAHNRSLGTNAALTIEWPPFDGVGMTADPAILHQLRRRGLSLLHTDRAAALLAADIGHPEHDVVAYLDRADAHLVSVLTTDRRRDRALLGDRTEDGTYRRIFDRHYDLWLDDHVINGVSYVPAATCIAMALGFTALAEGGPGSLADFEMLQAVPVRDSPVPLSLQLEKTAGGLGLRGRGETLHFRCRFNGHGLLGKEEPIRPETVPDVGPVRVYADGRFFHGPRFQVLHHCRIEGAGGAEGWIDTSRLLPVYGCEAWDRLTQWLDGAFQVLGLPALSDKQAIAIPIGVERVLVAALRVRPVFVKLETARLSIDDGDIRGDVVAIDEVGRLVFRLVNIRLRILSRAASNAATSRASVAIGAAPAPLSYGD
jgi:malonyl CoA-acyl carrier protein transacylase/NADP-dependent 3-hydroxy acid dehydrogenase YdfG/acyl carrier protein